jgi:hypothetical protein
MSDIVEIIRDVPPEIIEVLSPPEPKIIEVELRGIQGVKGEKGDKGDQADLEIGGYPVSLVDEAENNDVISFSSNLMLWYNRRQELLTDGGNF